ncbi:MAG: EF-hand domain-containing protein [Tabrizicola sp.]|uniref:EF-hand domain-containing protein n=1 Tax=Tabrizicola sp. TaxID=2005166 RepID=UPI0027337F64|nr:EF-hand domain-containing protein [Tabrizicola sp.]MDP3261990.1 EF-hand domain-containing protein [Tabrizicola sp.]
MKPTLAAAALILALSGGAFAQQGNPGQHFLEQWDGDADGSVTSAEVTTKRQEVFGMFDQDADAVLTAAEWALVEEHMALEMAPKGPGAGMNRAAPGKAMHEAMTPAFNDADGDGQVTLAEFDTASGKLFPLMDVNADGVVTGADFLR